MSANVWFEEVERGLKKEILSCVQYLSDKGKRVSIEPKAVFVRDPEADLTDEVFPCVSMQMITSIFNPKRYNPNPVRVGTSYETLEAVLEESAKPFDIVYQIDFWSRYKEDINIMTQTWLMNHGRQFNLDVTDDGGVLRSCNCLIKDNLKPSDLLSGGKRLFHSLISYTIWVELDNNYKYNKYMVAEENISAESVSGEKGD